ncbi:hypothetical protein C8J57DRAFT_1498847 [Mycena rebaudengoi]|nr:hypothetical protein C8J57DRAFT_1498847 [Mycena rebaudengoi]
MDRPLGPRELAQLTLRANQEHQYALALYAEKKAAELAELDKLLLQADTEDGDSELECDFYIPDAKPATGLIRNFLHPKSPFFEDAMRRNRYSNLLARHPMSPKETEALKLAVAAEADRLEKTGSKIPDSEITDKINWSVVAEKVSDRSISVKRTADECKTKWIGDISTSINRTVWSSSELEKLRDILDDLPHKTKVNWVEVATQLGTNRLPIECMRVGRERPRHTWNSELDQRLLDATKLYGTSWNLVARYVSADATPAQCSTRYLRSLDPSLHHGPWSAEEDKRLIAAIAGYGKNWPDVANVIPGRTNEQCRERWTSALDPAKTGETWTEEEDKALLEAVGKVGTKWKTVCGLVGNSRSATNCRVRYDKLRETESTEGEDESQPPSARATPKPKLSDNWTEEEDKALIEAVATAGRKWKPVSVLLGNNHSATSCRIRYTVLKPAPKRRASRAAGSSNLPVEGDEEESPSPSVRNTPKPAADDSQPAAATTARPRPRPLVKAKNTTPGATAATNGKKRATADGEDVGPARKKARQETLSPHDNAASAVPGEIMALAEEVDGTQDPRLVAMEDTTVLPAENPEQPMPAASSSNNSSSSLPRRSTRTETQAAGSSIPRNIGQTVIDVASSDAASPKKSKRLPQPSVPRRRSTRLNTD